MDQGSSPIKMWYHNCDDEGTLAPFTDFDRKTVESQVAGELKEGHESGAYVVSINLW